MHKNKKEKKVVNVTVRNVEGDRQNHRSQETQSPASTPGIPTSVLLLHVSHAVSATL